MLVDHIGYYLFPDTIWLRIIGRIAFPIFCFLVAYGCTKTRNARNFFVRLFVFALVSQLLISLALWEIRWQWLNVFFTLSAGVLSIILIKIIVEHSKKTAAPLIMTCCTVGILCLLLIADVFRFDYGLSGVLLIIMFYLVLWDKLYWKLSVVAIIAIFNILMIVRGFESIQWYSMLSSVFLLIFIDKKLKISKIERWSFYIFYPLHLVILILIGTF